MSEVLTELVVSNRGVITGIVLTNWTSIFSFLLHANHLLEHLLLDVLLALVSCHTVLWSICEIQIEGCLVCRGLKNVGKTDPLESLKKWW